MSLCTVRFTVNDRVMIVTGPPMRRLLDVLREEFHLTGSKEGCGEGECGACGVVMNGALTNSCLVPLVQLDGASITTIEGISDTRLGQAIQRAFVERGGTQCGICTPGMIVAAWWLARNRAGLPGGGLVMEQGDAAGALAGAAGDAGAASNDANADLAAGVTVRDLLAGNLCRCTGYDLIVSAVESALAAWPPEELP